MCFRQCAAWDVAGGHSVARQTVPSNLVDLGCTVIGCRAMELAFTMSFNGIHAGLCRHDEPLHEPRLLCTCLICFSQSAGIF